MSWCNCSFINKSFLFPFLSLLSLSSLKPKNSGQSNCQTKLDLLNTINPVDAQIQISKVKNTQNGGLLVGCSSDVDKEKFIKLAQKKLSDEYVVKNLRGINPRVRVAAISEKFTADEFCAISYSNE